jgi:adhesin transport system outer membrane protein
VINRFKYYLCFVLVVFLQLFLLQTFSEAADVKQSGRGKSGSSPPKVSAKKSNSSDDNSSTQLLVNVTTARDMAAPGEFIGYDLVVSNTSKLEAAANVRVMEIPPAGFKYKKGSVLVDGVSASDPVVSADGNALVFSLGNLPTSGSAKIHFEVEVTSGSRAGKVVNYVSAISSGGGKSNVSMLPLQVSEIINSTKKSLPETPTSEPTADITPREKKEPPASLPVKNTSATVKSDATDTGKGSDVANKVKSTPPSVDTTSQQQAALPIAQLKDNSKPDIPSISSFPVPEKRGLAELIGMSEISVLSDADGQFVKNMAKNQIFNNELAGSVGETSILESVRAGRGFNRESHVALARTEQAKAQTGQAAALLLPSVSVRVSTGAESSEPSVNGTSSDTHPRTDAALTVRQPLFDLPSFRDWRRRKAIEQARGENYRVSDGDAYISSVNAYLSLVSSRLQTDMTREFEAQLNELFIYVEKRTNAGAASVSDMARVRARRQATMSSRLEQESAHAAAGIEFVRLTNLAPRKVKLPRLEDVGASQLPKSFDMAVTEAMKSNPDIASLTAELQAAEIDKSTAMGRYLPRVDAEYTDNFSLHAGGDNSNSGQRDQRIMAVLNWSIFSGGSDYKNYLERTARHQELQYKLDDQRRRVVQTLSANYATLATTSERIATGYQELKSISTAAEAMSKRMLSGNQSLLDLLDVYDRFYQIRSRLVNLHILEMSTVAQLVRLTQGAPGSVSKVTADPPF